MKSLNYKSASSSKFQKSVCKGTIDVIKSATHERDMIKDVIKKYANTTNYNTVAFNAVAVAIGYTTPLNNT
jgi:hypothetical protein